MNRRPARHAALSAVALLALAGCGGNKQTAALAPSEAADPNGCTVAADTRIALATGNATGVYFALGNAYATEVASYTQNRVRVTAAETGASVQNIEQLLAGDYQVAFSLLDTAADAVAGKAAFEGKPAAVRALARIHTNYTQVIVRKDANIASLADMKGKRVSTGSPKSGTEVIALRLLTAAGLDPEADVALQRLDLVKSVDGMKSGTIDAMFFSGGLPTPGITDLLTTAADDVDFLDVTPVLSAMQQISPAYRTGEIPAETYKRPQAVPTIVVPNVLLVREDLDPNLACVLTKALFERRDALAAVNPAAKELDPVRGRASDPVALHPGAQSALDALTAAATPQASAAP